MTNFVKRLHQLEDLLLALLLSSMIGLAVLQIVARNFAGVSFTWIDPLLRVEVLWLGLLGAAAATRGGRHITIDILEPVLRDIWKLRLLRLANLSAAIVCAVVAWYSWQFVLLEREWPTAGVLGLDTWQQQLVIPFSFGLMALRFCFLVAVPSSAAKAANPPADEAK